MQKLYKFEAISRSENQYKWYKEARAQFYETRQRDAAGRWSTVVVKNLFKNPRILGMEIV